ncbi:MAG: nitroreductase family protein [Bacteroidales bacterium]|jgi:nitroreductase|nr:nitroreductase family protein [Bacteroidales bacterium]HOI32677.1 nitroreductase family protein [Bacteroidales bacterium]
MSEIPQEFIELLRKNRSYRKFNQFPVPDEKLLYHLVEITRFTASSKNIQPLKYVIVKEPQELNFVFNQLKWAWYLKDWDGPSPVERPTAYLVMLLDTNLNDRADFDAGIAAQTILLGATAAGFGGCIVRTLNRYAISRYFEIGEHLEIMMVLALGKPKQTIEIETVKNESVAYFINKNDVHIVPKRPVSDLIWKKT